MTQEKLIEKTDAAIAELVYPKKELKKAYNYYHGILDPELFRYLEENYGIGSPTSVEFIPLIKKYVDALIGEYLGTPIIPKVSCKDSETISNIDREKQLKIEKEVYLFLQKKLKNLILQFLDGLDITDKSIEELLNKLVEDINTNFISQYEIAAQNVIEYIMLSRNTDILTKLRHLLLDLLITGYTFYRVKESVGKNNVSIEVLDPLNTFVDRNLESPYVKDSYRVVVRHWYTKHLILNKYGRDLSREDVKKIKDEWEGYGNDYSSYYITNISHTPVPLSTGIYAGEEVIPGYPDETRFGRTNRYIPVYEVEWLETDNDFIMNRYTTVRIGLEIYILTGKDEDVVRSKDNPSYCGLSVNGVYFVNRTAEPYSLVKACEPMQDKYNLLNYYRDNLIANSGTVGDWIDLTMIPVNLGVTMPERIQKWISYKKQGIAFIDTALEGRLASGLASLNTIFNGYDDTVKALAIQAIQLAMDSVEGTVSSITGVFRERLNGIELRDAVTNIKQGVLNSFIITKQYYQLMDLVTMELLLDSLNTAKKVFKNGLTGTIILGEKYLKIFTALPEHFTVSDHDIHIITSSDIMADKQKIEYLVPDLVKANAIPADVIIDVMTSDSLTDAKYKVKTAIAKQKAENNQIMQLLQQGEQLLQQLKEMEKQLKQSQEQIKALDLQKMQLEQAKMQMQNKIDWYNAHTLREWKEKEMENDAKRIEVELRLLHDGNPYNDEIRQL